MSNASRWLLSMVLVSSVAWAAPRELRPERLLVVSGSEPVPVHVAAGWATTLVFDPAPATDGVRVEGDVPVPLVVSGASVVVVPGRDLRAEDGALLTVELSDGARLRFELVSVPDELDGRVRVLRGAAIDALRARLEGCESQGADGELLARYLRASYGNGAEGALVIRKPSANESGSEPMTFMERVEDRISGLSFLLLRVRADRALTLRRLRLEAASGGEVRILRALPEPLTFPAGQRSAFVLILKTAEGKGRLTLGVSEAAGPLPEVVIDP